MKKNLPLILVFTLLIGCASSGRKLDPEKVAQVQKGQTREQVLALLGSPEQTTRNAAGETIFNYMFVHSQAKGTTFIPIAGAFMGGADTQTQSMMVTFGPDGLVKDFVSSYGASDTSLNAEASSKAKLDDVESNKRAK